MHSEQIPRASAELCENEVSGCSSTTSDKLFELNGQEHCASSTRSVHLKHEESEL